MVHQVEWAESAVASLIDAIEYIARDSPNYAAAFAVRVERAAASLDMFPERGVVLQSSESELLRDF